MSEKSARSNYTKEFKQDAVKLVEEHGYSCQEAGRRLGIACANVSRWVRQHREEQGQVSRSGFYDYERYRHRRLSPNPEHAALEARAKNIFQISKGTYRSRRMVKGLEQAGYDVGRYRVRSLMRRLGLKAKTPRRYRVTTDSNHKHPVAPNRLDRQFEVDTPNRVWTTDISVPQKAA